MTIHTQTVRGLHRAPYRDQVLVHMIKLGLDDRLSADEEAKITRVARFLPAAQCASEIEEQRGRR
jgi:hypothetical protein